VPLSPDPFSSSVLLAAIRNEPRSKRAYLYANRPIGKDVHKDVRPLVGLHLQPQHRIASLELLCRDPQPLLYADTVVGSVRQDRAGGGTAGSDGDSSLLSLSRSVRFGLEFDASGLVRGRGRTREGEGGEGGGGEEGGAGGQGT
jgi:hypothetical protein